jgi:tetratricopeptide (TPR) repeat protein
MSQTILTEIKTQKVAVKLENVPPPPSPQEPKIIEETNLSGVGWDKAIRGILYVLTFLLPLLFTPWTFEPLEFSKQMLLFVLSTAALGAWALKLLVVRSGRLVKTPLDVPIGVFVLVYLLASIFSVDKVASFLGFYGSFSGNFFQVLFLVAFYYLVVNNFQTLKELRRLLVVFLSSVFLALVYIVLQFFGVFVVRFPFAKFENFNSVGGLLVISIFATVAVVLSLCFREKSNKRFVVLIGRIARVSAIIAAFLIISTVNFVYAWVGLLLGLVLYMVFQIAFSRSFIIKDLIVPLVLFVVTAAFLIGQLVFPFVSLRNLFRFNLPLEVRLDYTTAKPVLLGIVAEKPVLGSGPNTFLYAFSKHKAQSFNISPFWNVRFDKAPSEAAEMLAGTGILGFLAFEILSLVFLIYGFFFLFQKKDQKSWDFALAVFSGFAVLWFCHWFFFFNTVIAFTYWLLLAIFIALSRVAEGEKIKAFSFSFISSPRRTVSVVSAVSLALVLVIIFLFFVAAVYASDIFYRKGLVASQDPNGYDQAGQDFEQAIRLNRFRPDYYLTYGEFLFLRINQELSKSQPNLGLIQQWVASSINTSRAAVDLSPTNWTAWERLANLYISARPLVAGVDKFIIEALTKATETDPKNPILFVESGQVYRLAARTLDPGILGKGLDADSDGLSDEQEQVLGSNPEDPDSNGNGVSDGTEVLSGLNPAGSGALPDSFLAKYLKTDAESLLKAEQAFKKAIELKDDYANAYYQLALTLEQEGKLDEGIGVMEQVLQKFPTNIDLKFELGRMYYNSGKVEQAARQFQEILALMPTHANARFSLALSFERLGRTKPALDEYRKVLEANPDNEALKQKVSQLEQQLLPPPTGKSK